MNAAGRIGGTAALIALFLHIAPASAATTRTVQIRNSQYLPAAKQARIGDSVKWTNHDEPNQTPNPRSHTVTADSGSGETFDATLAPGASFTQLFTKSGTFAYHCKLVPSMHGSIEVPAPPTTLPPTSTTRRVTTTSRPATTTSRGTTSTNSTDTTDTLVLDSSTSEDTTSTTTAGQVAIKTTGGTSSAAVALLVVAIAAVLGGGGYVLYRLRSGRF